MVPAITALRFCAPMAPFIVTDVITVPLDPVQVSCSRPAHNRHPRENTTSPLPRLSMEPGGCGFGFTTTGGWAVCVRCYALSGLGKGGHRAHRRSQPRALSPDPGLSRPAADHPRGMEDPRG